MGVDRVVLGQGNGTLKPKKGDTVRLEYTEQLPGEMVRRENRVDKQVNWVTDTL